MKLLDYIQGLRKGKEAHQLEKESMKDPFLADAMDGYRQTEGDHEQRLETLRRWVISRSIQKQYLSFVWSSAASLFIGVCIGGYFLLRSDKLAEDHYLVQEAIPAEVPVVAPDKVIRQEPAQTKEADQLENESPPALFEIFQTVQDSDHSDIKSEGDSADIQVVRGTVIDQKGIPIVGASIAIKGTDKETITDINGNFALNTNGKEKLNIYFIGFESIILPADTDENLIITMNEDKTSLNENRVIGAATLKRENNLGATLSVSELSPGIKPKPLIGQELYEKYLKENLIRPSDDACGQVEGIVIVLFHVDKKGRPTDITVKQSLCESADREAVRLVQEGPDWTRGNQTVEVSVNF